MGDVPGQQAPSVRTDAIIIGAGPAGASLACFLSSYGIKGIIIDRNSSNADTPRAHITNMAALECLRDIGIDTVLARLSTKQDCMAHATWCHSMAGREYGRVYAWGNDPRRKGDYERMSPCDPCDLPQTLLDPELVRYASQHGFQMRWDTNFLSLEQSETGVTAHLLDMLTQHRYTVSAPYLFGADGGRSSVVSQLELPLRQNPGFGAALNVLVEADLSHLMGHRTGNLHWVMQPEKEYPEFAWLCVVRMVKPWHEWMLAFVPYPGTAPGPRFTEEDYLAQVRVVIGDDTPVRILKVNYWTANDTVAERYSHKRVYCLGDAVHRHPPNNGLGSNTCIQDAFNLAWKVAYTMKGKAGPQLLDTYSVERQPVGVSVVERASQAFQDAAPIMQALGILLPSVSDRVAVQQELGANTDEGRKRRADLREALAQWEHEFHGLGIEMNQKYASTAVGSDEALGPDADNPDPVLYHIPSTKPGGRLPHVWLNTAVPSGRVSTIDLAGKGGFTLFTGVGGEAWKAAAAAVSARLDVPIRAVSIGWDQDYEDSYYDWARVRNTEESGCVLARPDRFVGWRYRSMEGDKSWAKEKLLGAMRKILSLEDSA